MAKLWTFLDFVDGNGTNLIHDWINDLPKGAKAKMTTKIEYLEVTETFVMPDTRILHGECDGLFEIRFQFRRVQYRPLACYGPGTREVTVLTGAIEKENRFEPPGACITALSRKDLIQSDRRYVCPHDFS